MSTLTTNLTDEQARAICTRDVSEALSAGAGCGKTYVLAERFLAQLEPDTSRQSTAGGPARLSELVAITFTERAAREMRDRIRAKCYARLQAARGDEAAYWLDVLRSLDAARVCTIHSFSDIVAKTLDSTSLVSGVSVPSNAYRTSSSPQLTSLKTRQPGALVSVMMHSGGLKALHPMHP